MLSQKNNLVKIRRFEDLEIGRYVYNASLSGHLQNHGRNFLDSGQVKGVEIGIQDIRIDFLPVVVNEFDKVQHILVRIVQIGVFDVGSIGNSDGTSFLDPGVILRFIDCIRSFEVMALMKSFEHRV